MRKSNEFASVDQFAQEQAALERTSQSPYIGDVIAKRSAEKRALLARALQVGLYFADLALTPICDVRTAYQVHAEERKSN